jgi:protease II
VPTYDYYVRVRSDLERSDPKKAEAEADVLLDIGEVPFIPSIYLRQTLVDKFRVSDDNNVVAFTIDIGNTEHLTLGFKNLKDKKFLHHMIESVG